MTKAARFCQADVARAVAGARKGGLTIAGVEIDIDGRILITAAGTSGATGRPNPWDKLLQPKPGAQ